MARSLNILMSLFTRRYEGTFYRALPWASFLVSQGHRVTILCTSKDHLFRTTVSEENGVRIVETPALFSGRYVMTRLCGMYGWGPLDIFARWREACRGGYDVAVAFEHHFHVVLPLWLAGRKNIPIWIADSCDHYGEGGFREFEYSPYRLYGLYQLIGWPFRKLMDHLELFIRRRADAVTVISSYIRDRVIGQGIPAGKVHLIPGSADVESIHVQPKTDACQQQGLDPDLHYALFFGAGQFDVDFSLEAFERVQKKIPDSRFVVIGKKDPAVTRRATELGLQKKLIQTGWIEDGQLGGWLACADVCLLPMKDNAPNHARWPNKIGFYMAAGRPVVATDVNDIGPLIRQREIGRSGPVDVQAFADQIIELFENPNACVEMGRRARETAEREFSLPIHGSELERLFLTLAGAHHA
ncbi:glycosyltransferase family 4 protein [Tichowtungia aerotolerans]|uniref:Glycosyltransferase n=1 Tax=Tichowtungia aerotolerans TaxID=2697043 RepID=A0A6P1MCI5_9BACT|nr:glycosyltransferase family 4 protein [Tichowtungia aerotolerans]QHI70284.1 glycosyltransferase [Tichowtungia aerotolerans]